ncbi:hypothetical protein Ahy_A05g024746 isoform A [Arachis hypogaea]|uniref:Uncharacterized protein n=1 Tax=Arachis hypogaea TaxID=3818 RepID=A0A445D6J6_ARAHY|nr:hypothetical protein Ahy_A05g024746 isoform A [Arachis hypogaea]
MDIPPNKDLVHNDACNTQNMSLTTDCDLITLDFGDQIGTTIPSAKDDLVINDDTMRVVNMVRDEKIDKILESVSRIETMISLLSLNNDFKTPTKLSSQKTRPFSNRLKAKSSDIDIHTAISNDEDDLIELDKRSFTHDDAFNIKINMDKLVSLTIRAATKKKNISKGKTIMGIQKKLPFTPPGGVRKPKIEPKLFNKSKASYALSQPTKDYRRPVYFFSITNSMKCKFMPTLTMHLLEDQIKAYAYAFSASLDPSEELVVTDTIRATRSDFHHFIPDKPMTDKKVKTLPFLSHFQNRTQKPIPFFPSSTPTAPSTLPSNCYSYRDTQNCVVRQHATATFPPSRRKSKTAPEGTPQATTVQQRGYRPLAPQPPSHTAAITASSTVAATTDDAATSALTCTPVDQPRLLPNDLGCF